MKVWVYSGITGSGKTTLVHKRHPHAHVVSTDHFWGPSYDFDPSRIGEAHAWCLRTYVELLQHVAKGWSESSDIVVDNTNTSLAELAPYAALALAYRYELTVVTVTCDVDVAFARATHGAPRNVVEYMAANLAKRELPPWWNHETVDGGSNSVRLKGGLR